MERVETAAALPPTTDAAEAAAAKADAPRREYWDASRLSTKGSSGAPSTPSSKHAANLEEVFVDVEHSESGYENQIYWSDDGWETKHLIGVDDETKTVSLGKFERGAKIEFGIDNGQGEFYKTGRGSNNADGLRHAQVERHGKETRIGFEDLAGGGDMDFNDAIITVRRVAAQRDEALDGTAEATAAEASADEAVAASDGAEVTDAESTEDTAPAEETWGAEDTAPAEETWGAEDTAPAEETWAAAGSAAAEETWASEDTGSTEETWGTEEAVSTEEPESAELADQQVSYQDLLDNVPMSFEDYFS